MRAKLLLLSVVFIALFVYFSYSVAKERWQKADFDTTVKLQDHVSNLTSSSNSPALNLERRKRIDGIFSYFSLLGSAEVTVGFCLILAGLSLIRRRWLAVLGWLTIVPATLGEIFGKLIVFHPGPPRLFHRSLLPTSLPSFYVHTDYSYPSGHMTRTIFIVTIFAIIALFSVRHSVSKFVILSSLLVFAFLMGLTRVYLGEHWFSDVVGGAIWGVAVGLLGSVLILKPKRV